MSASKILLLNGPNLDMLGVREPGVYGTKTLRDVEQDVAAYASARGVALACFQSNSEAALIDTIHAADAEFDGIVYNPGAHTHYSYALRDAVAAISTPVVEIHISNVDEREPFRRVSVIAPACVAQVKGLGIEGYFRAVDILCDNAKLARLGEGYETRYPAGQPVVVSNAAYDGSEALGAPIPAAGPAGASDAARQEGQLAADCDAPAEDFAAPYAQDAFALPASELSAERLRRIRDACAQAGVDALAVRDTSNIRWALAVDGVFDDERAHVLAVTPSAASAHTDSRYSQALRAALGRGGVPVPVDDGRKGHVAFLVEALRGPDGSFADVLGFEDSVSYKEFAGLAAEFGPDRLASTSDLVLGLRAVKDRVEIGRLLAAQAVTDAAFAHIVGFIRPGMAERDVQLELEGYMMRHGAEGLAFSSIVATGANGADPHAIPGPTKLEAGQCVVIDFGAKAYGYCSDMTRVVFLGQPDAEMAHAWEVLRRANETVQSMLRPGVTGKQAHEMAERILAEGGFEGKMGHGLGHGVGLDIHELPVLNSRNDAPLAAGNVVTVEPGIYLPGRFGMRLEDCGVVTDAGYEPFSQIGHEMVIV